jgi:hypothetical protein
MNKNKTNFFRVNWYSDAYDKTYIDYGAVGATNYSEAMRMVEDRFPNLDRIVMYVDAMGGGFVFFDGKDDFLKAMSGIEGIKMEAE